MMQRILSGVRVTWASATAFATLGTAITTLLLIPLLNVAFTLLLGADLAAPNLVRTGYAAALVALATSVAGGIVSVVATDRHLGIFFEIHSRRRLDVAYWLAISVVPALLAAATGAMVIGSVAVFAGGALLGRVLMLALCAVVIGILLGVAAAGIGVGLPDPYLGATLLGSTLPLFTGVIVPIEACPKWLQTLSHVAPMRGIITALDHCPTVSLIVHDIVVAAAWASVGLGLVRWAVARNRAGKQQHSL